MKLEYFGKKPLEQILEFRQAKGIPNLKATPAKINRTLIKGENSQVMQSLIAHHNFRQKIDLVYIDPPFSSQNVFKIGKNRTATMSAGSEDVVAYADLMEGPEYLEFMRERLILLREMMSETATIYVHIDYKIGHYLKIIMDEVFGIKNFRHDITRIKCNPKNFSRRGFGNIKDMILMYTKSGDYTWNEPREVRDEGELHKLFNKIDSQGRRYTTNPLHAPGETTNGESGQPWNGLNPPSGRHWRYSHEVLTALESDGLIEWSKNGVPRRKIYATDFPTKRVQDIWNFKDKPNPIYPTEKNLNMLQRIIETSSNPGDLVLDVFFGSGGLLYIADKLERRWLGVDSSSEAFTVVLKRFEEIENSLFPEQPLNILSLGD